MMKGFIDFITGIFPDAKVWDSVVSFLLTYNLQFLLLDPNLENVLTHSPQVLRDNFVFKIVPMLNPDGVIIGNYRSSLAARDLNRNYKNPIKDAYPSIWSVKAMIRRWV